MTILTQTQWTNQSPALYLKIEYEAAINSTYGDTTDYTLKVSLLPNTSTSYNKTVKAEFKLNGNIIADTTLKSSSTTTWSTTLSQTAAGSVSGKYNGTVSFWLRVYTTDGTRTASYSFALPIPSRAPVISSPSGTVEVGGNITVEYTKQVYSKDYIYVYINNTLVASTTNVAAKGTRSVLVSTNNDVCYNAMSNSTHGTIKVKVTCRTADSYETEIGSSSITGTAYLSGVGPTISNASVTWTYLNDFCAAHSLRLKGYCRATISATITPGRGASLVSSTVTYNGQAYNLPYQTPVINTAGNITFTIRAQDSRGNVATYNLTVTVTDYTPPEITDAVVERGAYGGGAIFTPEDDGPDIRISFAPVYYRYSNNATITIGTTDYTAVGSGNEQQIFKTNISGETTLAWTIKITDELGNYSQTTLTSSSTSINGWDVKAGGTGVAFGKPAEQAGIDVADDWPVNIRGNMTFKGLDVASVVTYLSAATTGDTYNCLEIAGLKIVWGVFEQSVTFPEGSSYEEGGYHYGLFNIQYTFPRSGFDAAPAVFAFVQTPGIHVNASAATDATRTGTFKVFSTTTGSQTVKLAVLAIGVKTSS